MSSLYIKLKISFILLIVQYIIVLVNQTMPGTDPIKCKSFYHFRQPPVKEKWLLLHIELTKYDL